jgi:hypothetical protein
MRPSTVEAPLWLSIGGRMSLYSWFNKHTGRDEGYAVGEELPLTHDRQVVGRVRVIAQHKKMFSNAYYWTAERID